MSRSVPRPSAAAPHRALGAGVAGPPLAVAVLLAAFGGGTGCAVVTGGGGAGPADRDGPGDPHLAGASVEETVRDLPKARRGNMAEYTVRGRRYRTLESAAGYRERGVASWYGAKFHGRETSSGEPFDMHALSAAHRRLPLPTFVRVTNTANGASVVVRVNDRGPFVADRVIDLSYAAAARLGMLEHGTAEVELEALSTHLPPAPVALGGEASTEAVVASAAGAEVGAAATPPGTIQLGAFADDANAAALARRVAPHLDSPPRVERDAARALYRVRVGPIADAAALEAALVGLAAAGIERYTLLRGVPASR